MQNQKSNRIIAALVCAVFMLVFAPFVSAAGGALTVNARYSQNNTPVDGLSLELYRVADTQGNGYVTLSPFKDTVGAVMNDDDLNAENAAKLDAFLNERSIRCETAKTGNDGKAVFNGLDGVYLLRHASDGGYYRMSPLLIYIGADGAEVSPKLEYVPEGDFTPPPSPTFRPGSGPGGSTVYYTSVTVTKLWNDEDNAQGKRPASVTVRLYMDGTLYRTAALNAANKFKYTFVSLTAGHSYTVDEIPVEGYVASYSGSAEKGYAILNTRDDLYVPEPSESPEPLESPNPSEDPNPSEGAGGGSTPDPDAGTPTGTETGSTPEPGHGGEPGTDGNGETPPGTGEGTPYAGSPSVYVHKVWRGADARPESVIVRLYRDSSAIDSVTLSAENNWEHTFYGLDANAQYTVYEDEVTGYGAEYSGSGSEGFTITNSPGETNSGTPPDPSPPYVPGGNTDAPGGSAGGGKIPQTGMLMWPVPILISGGALMIIAGLIMIRRKNERNEE